MKKNNRFWKWFINKNRLIIIFMIAFSIALLILAEGYRLTLLIPLGILGIAIIGDSIYYKNNKHLF